MHSNAPSQTRRAPAALLALLLGLLLGQAGPGFAAADFGEAALSQPRAGKAALAARSVKRDSDEDRDSADVPSLWGGTAPNLVTDHLSIRPAGESVSAPVRLGIGRGPAPFDARAPPAA